MPNLGKYRFQPGLWPTVATLLLLILLVGLGFWQLERARQKQVLLDQYEGQGEAAIQIDGAALNSTEGLAYRPAQVTGQFDRRHQFLLDNRVYEGVPGYQVLTPAAHCRQ